METSRQPAAPRPKGEKRPTRVRSRAVSREQTPPDHIGVLSAAVLMVVGGYWGLYTLITTQKPFVGQRWIFFVLLHVAVTGTVMPFVRYLNIRFMRNGIIPSGGVIVRQSVWVGLFVVTCAWLQMPRVLNLGIAAVIALAFIVVETFIRSREIAVERENIG
jgi:hypothetical protein